MFVEKCQKLYYMCQYDLGIQVMDHQWKTKRYLNMLGNTHNLLITKTLENQFD